MHAEIIAEKKRLQELDLKNENDLEAQEDLRKKTLGQWEQEFDDISKDMKIVDQQTGELRTRRHKYLSREDQMAEMHSINLREATDTRLVFRRIPVLIWLSGTLITVASVYLLYHLALGQLGVLFNGYR